MKTHTLRAGQFIGRNLLKYSQQHNTLPLINSPTIIYYKVHSCANHILPNQYKFLAASMKYKWVCNFDCGFKTLYKNTFSIKLIAVMVIFICILVYHKLHMQPIVSNCDCIPENPGYEPGAYITSQGRILVGLKYVLEWVKHPIQRRCSEMLMPAFNKCFTLKGAVSRF